MTECCRCGYCCLIEACELAQEIFNIDIEDACPALSFDDEVASCGLLSELTKERLVIGGGCSMRARLIADNEYLDFASLSKENKFQIVQLQKEGKLPCLATLSKQQRLRLARFRRISSLLP